MRRLGVSVEADVNGGKRYPLAIRRDGGLADALELHHVFKGEGMLGLGLGEERESEQEECDAT